MKSHNFSRLYIHFAAVLAGGSGVFAKLVAQSPFVIVFGRALIAALVLGVVIKISKPQAFGALRDHGRMLVLSGVLLAVHWVTFFQAIRVSTVAIGVLAFSLFPVFVVFFEHRITGTKISAHDVFISFLALTGVVLTTGGEAFTPAAIEGMAWGVFSGFLYALNLLLNRYRFIELPAEGIALAQFTVAALVLTPFFVTAYTPPSVSDVAFIVVLGVVFTAVLHLLVINAVKTIRAHSASIILILEPVYGIGFAAIILAEMPSLLTFVGGGLIVMAALSAR